MTETEIQKTLIAHFDGEGYKTWPPEGKCKHGHGPDVVAYHPDRHHLWIIEAKSDVKNSSTDPSGGINRSLNFGDALRQICQRRAGEWKPKTGCGPLLPSDIVTYGLAFSEDYRPLCHQIRPEVRLVLSLYLFFLRPDDSIPTIIGPHVEDINSV
jgi:type I site-specific restriction endonuclease